MQYYLVANSWLLQIMGKNSEHLDIKKKKEI